MSPIPRITPIAIPALVPAEEPPDPDACALAVAVDADDDVARACCNPVGARVEVTAADVVATAVANVVLVEDGFGSSVVMGPVGSLRDVVAVAFALAVSLVVVGSLVGS